MLLPLAAAPWLTTWLTTIWLIGVGMLLGLGVLLLLWGLLFLVRRKAAAEVTLGITEGVLLPLTFIVVFTAAFGIVGAFFARDPITILQSIPRLPYAGQQTVVTTIPAGDEVSSDSGERIPTTIVREKWADLFDEDEDAAGLSIWPGYVAKVEATDAPT